MMTPRSLGWMVVLLAMAAPAAGQITADVAGDSRDDTAMAMTMSYATPATTRLEVSGFADWRDRHRVYMEHTVTMRLAGWLGGAYEVNELGADGDVVHRLGPHVRVSRGPVGIGLKVFPANSRPDTDWAGELYWTVRHPRWDTLGFWDAERVAGVVTHVVEQHATWWLDPATPTVGLWGELRWHDTLYARDDWSAALGLRVRVP